MKCDDCRLVCPAKAEPENVKMGEAIRALVKWCSIQISPPSPMSWIRGYIEKMESE